MGGIIRAQLSPPSPSPLRLHQSSLLQPSSEQVQHPLPASSSAWEQIGGITRANHHDRIHDAMQPSATESESLIKDSTNANRDANAQPREYGSPTAMRDLNRQPPPTPTNNVDSRPIDPSSSVSQRYVDRTARSAPRQVSVQGQPRQNVQENPILMSTAPKNQPVQTFHASQSLPRQTTNTYPNPSAPLLRLPETIDYNRPFLIGDEVHLTDRAGCDQTGTVTYFVTAVTADGAVSLLPTHDIIAPASRLVRAGVEHLAEAQVFAPRVRRSRNGQQIVQLEVVGQGLVTSRTVVEGERRYTVQNVARGTRYDGLTDAQIADPRQQLRLGRGVAGLDWIEVEGGSE